jgi:hypothetical protein
MRINKAQTRPVIAAVGVAEEERALPPLLERGIHAVRAIVTEGLNRDRIEPPQPTFSLYSYQRRTSSSYADPETGRGHPVQRVMGPLFVVLPHPLRTDLAHLIHDSST